MESKFCPKMTDEKYALVEKIVKDVHNVLCKTVDLYSFDIIPVHTNLRNKSPVVCVENCLGLESWCVKQVYLHCYSELMENICAKSQRQYKKSSLLNSESLVKLLNVTLLINPDLCVLWNKRRNMLQESLLDSASEMKFTSLVLSRKPKCNDAFAYRRWILETFILNGEHVNTLENAINTELRLCDLASDKSPNNYHSWSHRLWLISKLRDTHKDYDLTSLLIKEYSFSERWTSKHVSDFSCFHYRQFCVKNMYQFNNSSWKAFENSLADNFHKGLIRIIAMNFPKDGTMQMSEQDLLCFSDENLMNLLISYDIKKCSCSVDHVILCRKLEVLCHELILNNELVRFYKHHESLWYHRRFILHEIINMMYNHFGLVRCNGVLVKKTCKQCRSHDLRQKQAKITRYDSDCISNSILFQVIVSHERKFVEERLNDGDNYADRHVKYLKFVQGLNSVM